MRGHSGDGHPGCSYTHYHSSRVFQLKKGSEGTMAPSRGAKIAGLKADMRADLF